MKNIGLILFFAVACLLSFSCTGRKNSHEGVARIDTACDSVKDIKIESVRLDSVPTSYEIQTSIVDGQIMAVDLRFCYLYRFSPDGHIVKRQLGQGDARYETTMGRIAGHCFSDEGKLILVGYSGETCVYDSSISREKIFVTDYSKRSMADLATVECYDKPLVYSKHYDELVCRDYNGKVYYNVDMFTPVFNIVDTPDAHIANAYNLMSVDYADNGETSLWIKGLPPYYEDDTNRKVLFVNHYFDISGKGDIYIAHEADSCIYIYDEEQNLKTICGRAAKDMRQDYSKCSNILDFRKHYEAEHASKGRFTSLEYVDQTGLLFRTYQRGGDMAQDGMQIYKDGVLIGDVDVPHGMHVVGYIEPYYYSQIMADEDNEVLNIYRFRL